MTLTLETIRDRLNSRRIQLNTEQAICYVSHVLIDAESYGTELINMLDCTDYVLSDTILYAALYFLKQEGFIASRQQKLQGRGRPRTMFYISTDSIDTVKELASFWQSFVANTNQTSC